MSKNVEYQIYIGLNDQQQEKQEVKRKEFCEIVQAFFEEKKIDFSFLKVQGGYLNNEKFLCMENSLCINIINPSSIDIASLARTLSMYTNQECVLIVKNELKNVEIGIY